MTLVFFQNFSEPVGHRFDENKWLVHFFEDCFALWTASVRVQHEKFWMRWPNAGCNRSEKVSFSSNSQFWRAEKGHKLFHREKSCVISQKENFEVTQKFRMPFFGRPWSFFLNRNGCVPSRVGPSWWLNTFFGNSVLAPKFDALKISQPIVSCNPQLKIWLRSRRQAHLKNLRKPEGTASLSN